VGIEAPVLAKTGDAVFPFEHHPFSRRNMIKSGTVAALAVAVILGSAGVAGADTYTVRGCSTGWTAHADTGSAATDNCATIGGMTAQLTGPGPWDGGTFAYDQFTAPPGTRIVRVTLGRKTQGMPVGSVRTFSYTLSADGKTIEACAPGPTDTCTGDLDGPLDAVGLDAASVLFSFGCGADDPNVCTPAPGLVPSATITDPSVVLRDQAAPTVTSRTVTDDGESSGHLKLAYAAADAGGGVYRTVVRVDGKVAVSDPIGGSCADRDPADDDAYEFTTPVPCPATATRAVDFDVLKLPLAEHAVEVDVEDAAGNSTAVYGPVVLPKANGTIAGGGGGAGGGSGTGVGGQGTQPATGLDARLQAWFVPNHAKSYSSRYGRRVVIRGLLRTKAKKAVGSARLDVYHQVGTKLRQLTKTGLKTRHDGRLTLILPLNLDTRRIVLVYRAFRPGKITSRQTLKLTVRDSQGRTVRKAK
jgi:hypothetical protein